MQHPSHTRHNTTHTVIHLLIPHTQMYTKTRLQLSTDIHTHTQPGWPYLTHTNTLRIPSPTNTYTHTSSGLLKALYKHTHSKKGGVKKTVSAHEELQRGRGVKQRWSGLEKVQRSGTITPPPQIQADLSPEPPRYGPSPRSALSGYSLRLVWTPPPPSHSLGHGLECYPDVKDGAEAEEAAGLET